MNLNQPIGALLHDGTIEAEVARRLRERPGALPSGLPRAWSAVDEARAHLAVATTLSQIRADLEAHPGLTWPESMELDVLLSQSRLRAALAHVRHLRIRGEL